MAEQSASQAALAAGEQRVNLREIQEEALSSLYAVTFLAGLALLAVAIQFSQAWRAGFLGIALMFAPYLLYRLLVQRYLARAWLLVAYWLASALAGVLWLPGQPAACLLALPVGLAAWFIGARGGLATAVAASAAVLLTTRGGPAPGAVGSMLALATIWGVFVLAWLATGHMRATVGWSWERYSLARQRMEEARDARADLKQAIKDLAEAGVQMARLNQLLGAARRVAEEAERAKAEFVANVSHELRTPLNMVVGFAEMILQAPKAYGRIPPALRADLAVILRNSEHLANLIDDVLDLSQIEAGRMALTKEPVALREIVEAAAEAIRPLFESKGLYLLTEVPEGLVLLCDRTRIREVLLNLLSNAGRFTERGGVRVRARAEGQEVTVSVADTGPGIAPESQARLFQPFQQLDASIRRRYGGTGLGLSISKHFVELHDGRMWLESEVNQGTTIHFSLPAGPPAIPGSTPGRWLHPDWEYRQRTRPWLAPAPVVRPRLVVVESGRTLQRLVGRYLGHAEVTVVKTLEEAATELARVPAQALLVNDLSVGQTLERVRQSSALPYGTPAIVCALPGEREAADALGVESYLVKPISREALLAALDRLGLERGTVLIVDDEPEVIRLFWRMLMAGERRYRVLTATNGQQALNILREQRLDVVLLDLVMPAMDGFQLLAKRKEEPAWRDTPVIVMSARDPAGHPIVTSAVGITRGGGLTVAQLLACVESVTGPIVDTGQSEHPTPPEALPG